MTSLFAQSELYDLIHCVEKCERLESDAGVRMMKSQDILALGYMANIVRERKNGNKTFFTVSQHSKPTKDCAHFTEGLNPEEQIDHMIKLRTLQDRTGEFRTFSPLPSAGIGETTGFEDLKILAISRIMLDNFDHIQAFWTILGPKLAQVSLAFGVDVLGSGEVEERDGMSKRALIHMIQKAGRDAVERDTL